jgi:hypothetical protein
LARIRSDQFYDDSHPNLPLRFQNSFEKAKANAELAYATRGDKFPHHPHFAESGLHLPLLMHTVFFAYCEQARDALKNEDWTLAELRRATEAAWLAIFDFYLFRERGSCSEEQKATYRTAVWRTVTDDVRWKQHLLEVATFRGQEDVESREESSARTKRIAISQARSPWEYKFKMRISGPLVASARDCGATAN